MKDQIQKSLHEVLQSLGFENSKIILEIPEDLSHGDLTTNIALILSKNSEYKNPRELAEKIVGGLNARSSELGIDRVEVAGPGFINFWYAKQLLADNLQHITKEPDSYGDSEVNQGKKIMVEYAHPNTHKEMHIGHMRTLITGEALARIIEATGAEVFRANYQGDIGPHVAKALYGIKNQELKIEDLEDKSHLEKAKLLGEAYALGSKAYEENEAAKSEIDDINTMLYEESDQELNELYDTTRRWSLEYYDDFYRQFYTTFDKLFFESEIAESGKEIVKKHLGNVFVEDEGAIIFPGKNYGLHNRVFITSRGMPTYEGKEMGNAYAEFEAFPFDKKIHVVGSEQAGYFKVVFKALELIDPEKFEGKQHHVSMGMVQFTDRKMSSRTGDVLRVDWLVEEEEKRVAEIIREAKINKDESQEVIKQVAIGAIKYSVLKVGTGQDVAFDINQSVSLEGNSGPYLQYTYARTQSIVRKVGMLSDKYEMTNDLKLEKEEEELLRLFVQFPSVVSEVAEKFSPNLLCNYLFELAQLYNLFYQKHKIVGSEKEAFRVVLTEATGQVIKNGLSLLGIQAPEKM